jgi:hypothetical protein
VVLRELIQYRLQFLIKALLHIITFILGWCMNIENSNITATNSYTLNC